MYPHGHIDCIYNTTYKEGIRVPTSGNLMELLCATCRNNFEFLAEKVPTMRICNVFGVILSISLSMGAYEIVFALCRSKRIRILNLIY